MEFWYGSWSASKYNWSATLLLWLISYCRFWTKGRSRRTSSGRGWGRRRRTTRRPTSWTTPGSSDARTIRSLVNHWLVAGFINCLICLSILGFLLVRLIIGLIDRLTDRRINFVLNCWNACLITKCFIFGAFSNIFKRVPCN